MKKTIIFITALSLVALSSGVVLGAVNNNDKKEVNAYSISSLPTTIDLNDTSVSNIRSYYSELNSLSSIERSGTNLLKNLKPILSNNQKYYSYDTGSGTNNSIWKMYEISDRDWDKSPASSITNGTYNSSTNTITGYTYAASTSTSDSRNPYVHALYVNRTSDNPMRAWGNHNQTEGGINREHIWPKSYGFQDEGAGGARGDPMHLWAADGYVNGTPHNNKMYGYVDTSKSYNDVQQTQGYTTYTVTGNLDGTSKTLGGSASVFEPQDCDKGDIARACFYMVARYNNYAGDTSGFDTNEPNLELGNVTYGSTGTSTASTPYTLGILSDLLEWNRIDPPDEYEIHRNNLLYTNFTNNRNPFIDFPEWAEYIWGTSNNGSYSFTTTGYAKPNSDAINNWNSGSSDPISVTGISISPESVAISIGETQQLTPTIVPSNATNQNVTYTSSNTNVATVSNTGLVSAIAIGNATITVTTEDGHYSATSNITVNNVSSLGTDVYQLVTGNNPISAGDEVIIAAQANQSSTSCYVLSNEVYKTYYLTAISGTSNNQILNVTDDMTVWTVGGTSGNYSFHSNTGYLYGLKNGSYYNIYATGDNSTNNNWNVVLNSASTGYDVYNSSSMYLEYYSSYSEFTCYSRSATDYVINFYKKVTTAEDFATTFLNSVSCDSTGNSAPTLSKTWNELGTLFTDIYSLDEQNILKNATYTVSGSTVTATNGTSYNIALAMSKYDIIVSKYSYNDFISRKNTSAFGYVNKITSSLRSSNIPMIIIISSVIAMSGLGLYLYLHKKKEQ